MLFHCGLILAGMGTVAQTMSRRLRAVPAQAVAPSGGPSAPPTFALLPPTQQPHSHVAESGFPAVAASAAEVMHAVSTRTPHDQMDAAQALDALLDLEDIIMQAASSNMASGDITAVRTFCQAFVCTCTSGKLFMTGCSWLVPRSVDTSRSKRAFMTLVFITY